MQQCASVKDGRTDRETDKIAMDNKYCAYIADDRP